MPSPSDLTCTSKIQSRVRSLSSFKIDKSNLDTISGVDVPLVSAKHKKIDFKSLASKQKAAASNITRQISRIAILIAALSRPKKRLSAAVDKKMFLKSGRFSLLRPLLVHLTKDRCAKNSTWQAVWGA